MHARRNGGNVTRTSIATESQLLRPDYNDHAWAEMGKKYTWLELVRTKKDSGSGIIPRSAMLHQMAAPCPDMVELPPGGEATVFQKRLQDNGDLCCRLASFPSSNMTTPQPENAHILNLPNELIEERSSSSAPFANVFAIFSFGVCIQTIRYYDVRDMRPFLEVLPFQGAKYVVHLDLVLYPICYIVGYDLLSLLHLLHCSIQDFTLLESLRLDIRPTPRDWEDSGMRAFERAPADVMPLSPEILHSLTWVFRSLPEKLHSLTLSGFCLEDAIPGLQAARLPSLRFLSLDLNGSEMPDHFKYTHFLQGMPRLESIELPVQWCPSLTWFRRAFAGRSFKHIKVGFKDTRLSADADTHEDHSGSPCQWNACIASLFEQSSSRLETVNIGTISLIIPASVSLPAVKSLTLLDIEFGPEADSELYRLLAPFFESPLKTLEMLQCHDISATFVGHFRKHWPDLKTLCMSELTTVEDENDPPGIGYPYNHLWELHAAWAAESRRELEYLCELRKVDASLDWEYAEMP
ncbi:hypothetical protein IW261DRAFT_1571909 [Armillaria novae-zelandiae]|uniref:Uncharacterized protein n=1 Tax=Armillaria novae-zelandiae TaxID=153914 RepID=A0AA39NTM5_9AGAR|nr:hypothetical protein IW261DRAFT_1571909 [Armillaria novae-zelandiae]